MTSRIMSAVRSRDTVPEMLVRRELHRRGLRYRVQAKLPGRPDLAFLGPRLAVFIDGDFWHGHGWRERGFESFEAQFESYAEPEKWRQKIARNVERDAEVNAALTQLGWRVHRVLESRVRADLETAADEIEGLVRAVAD